MACLINLNVGRSVRFFDTWKILYLKQYVYQQYSTVQTKLYFTGQQIPTMYTAVLKLIFYQQVLLHKLESGLCRHT
jgi:hypothetical protein